MIALLLLLGVASADPTADAATPLAEALVLEFGQDGYTAPTDALLTASCEAGQPLACARAEWMGSGRPNLVQAARVAGPLCDDKDPAACLVVGWAATQIEPGTPDRNATDPAEGAKALQLACDAGLQRACSDLGTLWNKGVGISAEEAPQTALPLYRTACEAGVASACRWLGTLYHAGRGVPRDLKAARAQYLRACEAGLPGGCNNLGLAAQLGLGVEQDRRVAADHYIASCQRGFRPSCLNLDQLLAGGPLPGTDAAAIHQTACTLGSQFGCHHHAEALRPTDPTTAAGLFATACEAGVVPSCSALGYLKLSDAIGAPDRPAGAVLLEKACDGGDAVACHRVGTMLRDGDGIDADGPRAATLLEAGCADGYAPACVTLARQYRKGLGIKKDKAFATVLLERACELGDHAACEAP